MHLQDPDGKPELHTHFVNKHTGHITLPYRASSAKFALNRRANIIWFESRYSQAKPSETPFFDYSTIIVTESSLVEAW